MPDNIKEAIELGFRYGSIDGGHHKMCVIDQMLRILSGDDYTKLVNEYNGEEYYWDEGIAP